MVGHVRRVLVHLLPATAPLGLVEEGVRELFVALTPVSMVALVVKESAKSPVLAAMGSLD